MKRGVSKKETKQEYRVLKPIVGWPDEDGVVKDLVPYLRCKTKAEIKKHGGNYVRDDAGHPVRAKMIVKQFPSKVGHLVHNKSLILESEFAAFYPEEAAAEAEGESTGGQDADSGDGGDQE